MDIAVGEKVTNPAKKGTVRIAVLLAQLRGAGIQRMRFNIIKRLLEMGFEVDLVVGTDEGELAQRVPRGASLHVLGKNGVLGIPFGLVAYLRERKPTHVMSSYEDLSILLLLANKLLHTKSFILISTHNAISKLVNEGGPFNALKQRCLRPLMRLLYPSADSLVTVSEGVAKELNSYLNLPLADFQVIYNPVIGEDFESQMNSNLEDASHIFSGGPVIGYFGRLHEQKRVDLLIAAFDDVRRQKACSLLLVGEGSKRESYECLATDLGVGDDVYFYGFSDNPFPLMTRCDVVVLPSDYEGLGNVLIEAMACGTQVISTNCPHGPSEILKDGIYGQLVEVGQVNDLRQAILRTLDGSFWVDPDILKCRAREFNAETATDKYLKSLGF